MNCPDDAAMQSLVEGRISDQARVAIIAHAEECETCRELLAALVGTGPSPRPAESVPARGARIDRFLILEHLGSGGMGVVVSAYDPDLDRKVAIKLLRGDLMVEGPAAASHRVRLIREAQVMAKLSHPNVITVYQVGTSGDQVFVVMELIDGGTLRTWLGARPRSWREVRDLFERAGRGLAAAHAAGLVHRDFKPENVMVGDAGRVCVTDFGLVRVSPSEDPAPSSTELSLTRTGALVGTPRYMAPEQFRGTAVEARADQFSFCVSLFEALFGMLPFPGDTVEELAVAVREGRVREIRNNRCPAWLRRVVLRGLRPDPDQRYPSMNELLAELGRDRVLARRRTLVAGGISLAGMAALVPQALDRTDVCGGAEEKLAGVWDANVRAVVRRRFAASAKPYADASFARVAEKLDRYTRSWATQHRDICLASRRGEQSSTALDLRMSCLSRHLAETRALTSIFAAADADVVTRSVQAVTALPALGDCEKLDRLAGPLPAPDPATQTTAERIRATLATAYAQRKAGRLREAMTIARPALAEARRLGYPPLEAEAHYLVARLSFRDDPKLAALELRAAALAADAGRHDTVRAEAQTDLVEVVGLRLERFDEALVAAETAAAAVARLGDSPMHRAYLDIAVGQVLERTSKVEEARSRYANALALSERVPGRELDVARALVGIGNVALVQGKFAAAADYQQRSLAIYEKALGPDHPSVAMLLYNLSSVEQEQGKLERAQASISRAVLINERALGPDHPEFARTLGSLGWVLHDRGDYVGARTQLERALAIYERVAPDSLALAQRLEYLGMVAFSQGRTDESWAAHQRVLAIRERVAGPKNSSVGFSLTSLAQISIQAAEHERALRLLQRARAILEPTLGPRHHQMARVHLFAGAALSLAGRQEEALARAQLARAIYTEVYGADHADVAWARQGIGEILFRAGKYDQALAEHQGATETMDQALGPTHPRLAGPLTGLGEALIAMHRPADAVSPLERALTLREHDAAPVDLATTAFALARALSKSRRDPVRANALARRARDAYVDAGTIGRRRLPGIEAWLARAR